MSETEQEYATQFFGYTVKSFCNRIYNSCNFFMLDGLHGLRDFLQQHMAATDLSEELIDAGCERIRRQMVMTLEKSFDKLEFYLGKNPFRIPSHVLLDEDGAHEDGEVTSEQDSAVEEDITALTQQILSLKCANASLRQEIKTVEKAQSQAAGLLEEFTHLQRDMNQCGVSDLRESLSFTLDRIYRCLEATSQVSQLSQEITASSKESSVCFSLNPEMEKLGWNVMQESPQSGES